MSRRRALPLAHDAWSDHNLIQLGDPAAAAPGGSAFTLSSTGIQIRELSSHPMRSPYGFWRRARALPCSSLSCGGPQ